MSIQAFDTRHRVSGSDCGFGGPFRPLSLANFFQEAAGDHASVLGIGMADMFASGRTWMLSRVDIEVERLPHTGDEVIVRTWPAGTSRLFAHRYICLLSSTGQLMAGALYEYLIIDMGKRRPLRPERILDPGMVGELPPPYSDLSPGLQDKKGFSDEELQALRLSFGFIASPRHIDYNGHVNNGHIIDWLCDAVPLQERGSGAIKRLKVDFVAEVRLGEKIDVLSGKCEGGSRTALLRGKEIAARAFIAWVPG
ncbi:MAG: thioesterase [Spirochaetes bacterium]|nr:thioesterase [Spirochaetota bacterium]